MDERERTLLIPIAEALPELRAEHYAKVRDWDAARMALEGEFEAADGEYLAKIRDALKPQRLWLRYLEARGIATQTAYDRIHKAEGRYVRSPHNNLTAAVSSPPALPAPTYEPAADWPMMTLGGPPATGPVEEAVYVPRQELRRLEQIEQDWEQRQTAEPEPLARDVLPTTAPQWERRLEEIAAETPSIQAGPMIRLISTLHAVRHVTDENVEAWRSLATSQDLAAAAELFARVSDFSARVQRHIQQQRQGHLRLVGE